MGTQKPPMETLVGLRLKADQIAVVDDWIRRNEHGISRPEAIRRMMAIAAAARR
jgi:hypothetical protein